MTAADASARGRVGVGAACTSGRAAPSSCRLHVARGFNAATRAGATAETAAAPASITAASRHGHRRGGAAVAASAGSAAIPRCASMLQSASR